MKAIKQIILYFKIWFELIVLKIKFKNAKREADRLHLITGKEYHVMKIEKGYKIVDNTVVNLYNKMTKRTDKPKIDTISVRNSAVYSTKRNQ